MTEFLAYHQAVRRQAISATPILTKTRLPHFRHSATTVLSSDKLSRLPRFWQAPSPQSQIFVSDGIKDIDTNHCTLSSFPPCQSLIIFDFLKQKPNSLFTLQSHPHHEILQFDLRPSTASVATLRLPRLTHYLPQARPNKPTAIHHSQEFPDGATRFAPYRYTIN